MCVCYIEALLDAFLWLYYSACARTKRQAKRQAASQLLEQLSGAAEWMDISCKNDDMSAAADGHCPETTLASFCHLLSTDIFFWKCPVLCYVR